MKIGTIKKNLCWNLAILPVLLVGINTVIHAQEHNPPTVSRAVARIFPTENSQCSGVVTFEEENGKVRIRATITGLTPNEKHGFHIHEFGDISKSDGTSAGGHYNPEGHQHALPQEMSRHAGDLGNLIADSQGKAVYENTVGNITIAGMKNPIIGRAIIIHAKEDDGGQPSGNAGARIGMGVIGIAKE